MCVCFAAVRSRIAPIAILCVAAFLGPASGLRAQMTPPLPVKEVTVFKDGNAFVLREGNLPVNSEGQAVVGDLPEPALGTFWPYAAEPGVRVTSVTAAWHKTTRVQLALSVREMLEDNIGAEATITEISGEPYPAQILAVPRPEAAPEGNPFVSRDAASGQSYPVANASHVTPGESAADSTGNLVLLKTDRGVKAVGMDRIQEVTLPTDAHQTRSVEGRTSDLTLRLSGAPAGASERVGVMYLQPGIRWIPSYRVTLDGKGHAFVELEATVLNELADLDGVTVNLVIGVPSFAMEDTPDPIGLQDAYARLSPYFRQDALTPGALGRSVMTQTYLNNGNYMAGGGFGGGGLGAASDAAAPVSGQTGAVGGDRNEDLFVFTVANVHLRRYERMVLPVTSFTIPYRDVYTAELRPSAIRTNNGYEPTTSANADAARMLALPQVLHKVRLTNSGPCPLTSAPALILRDGRLISQGMMHYTARRGTSDLTLTTASDVSAKRSDTEQKRTENALQFEGVQYERVDLTGDIEVWNYRPEPVEIEVTRYVLGKVDGATASGSAVALDPYDDDTLPDWLSQYDAGTRIALTGLGKVTWTVTVPPGGVCKDLDYTWHYFVR